MGGFLKWWVKLSKLAHGTVFLPKNDGKHLGCEDWRVFPTIWVFPKIGVPQNGWFIMENPIKMHDLGIPLFLETSI